MTRNLNELNTFSESFETRLCRSAKYTAVCLVVFAILVVIGVFVPMNNVKPGPPVHAADPDDHEAKSLTTTEDVIAEHLWLSGDRRRGENLMVFVFNVLTVVGMVMVIAYTAYGMSSLPIGMIRFEFRKLD